MSRLAIFAVAVLTAAACSKADPGAKPSDPPAKPAAAPATVTTGADGLRHVSVEADNKGYHPDRIAGKPGEKIVLTVTRTTNDTCLSQMKTPDGTVVDLPKGQSVDVAMVVPKSGEATFTCGMGMSTGTIVADPTM
jgi:plastocyanin domain-containing protein